MRKDILIAWAMVCVLVLAQPVLAQVGDGSLRGYIRDEQGAVVPGAKVTVTSPALIQPDSDDPPSLFFCCFLSSLLADDRAELLRKMDARAAHFGELSRRIWEFAELGYRETRSAEALQQK